MGWEYLQGDIDYPQKTFRDNFRDVLLYDHIKSATKRINKMSTWMISPLTGPSWTSRMRGLFFGISLIIECKSPSLAETDDGGFWKPIESGINQLLRYSNQREDVELVRHGATDSICWQG